MTRNVERVPGLTSVVVIGTEVFNTVALTGN